jgi:glutamate synthase (NADPH/NADH) small chain
MLRDDLNGFRRYSRREPGKQPAAQRVRHWHEYARALPEIEVEQQADRCMDCATPGCHRYCPVHNLIPEWNALVFNEHWRRAYSQLESTNNFPEFTGRLCPAPCEDACTLALGDRPVTIKAVELAIAEHAWHNGWVTPRRPPRRRRETVTIVGSGPAGLACAQQLVRAGYRVTVLEKADRVGGLLRYGIPDFRLDKTVLDRRLAQLRAEGVEFVAGMHVGVDSRAYRWLAAADAVVLACGAQQPRDLSVPGRMLAGIDFALPYLTAQNRINAGDEIREGYTDRVHGADVVVIGGGDTGQDCLGTALRQGAASVTQIQYHEQPPYHADILRHWPQPAPVMRRADTEEEGARRLWGWDTAGFEGRNGRIRRVVLHRLHWRRTAQGGWEKQALDAPPRYLPAQQVLLAMGYAHPVHAGLIDRLSLALDRRGNVQADAPHFRTSAEGFFACGDTRRGQSLVVWAIREGRQCARAVDEYLSGHSELPYV